MGFWNSVQKIQDKTLPLCSMIVAAAGTSTRMGGQDKLFARLGGSPVLMRTLCAIDRAELVNEIVVAAQESMMEEIAGLCVRSGLRKRVKVVKGGASRTESVLAAALECDPKAELIAIHDGARPLVSVELIENTVRAAAKYKAAVPAIKSVDTLKLAEDGETVTGSLDRELVLRVQTPQVFDADLIKGALTFAAEKKLPLTDDCSAVELMGVKARIVPGEEDNIKLTTPRDMLFAAAILKDRGEYLADRAWV